MEKKYVRSIEELQLDEPRLDQPAGDRQFILGMEKEVKKMSSTTRRDFLKTFGFTIASAAIASSCEQPVRKAIPYLIQPEEVMPGSASYYASTFYDGVDYCSILVKVRDGRPIKIEGNTLSSITKGGTNSRTQAAILGLYDNERLKFPMENGSETTWEQIDEKILDELEQIKAKNGTIAILTPTIISPSTKAVLNTFEEAYPNTKIVAYDAISSAGILQANKAGFGKAFIPSYRFDKARIIVSFDADFLGSWLSPIEYTKQYVKGRDLTQGQRKMSRHIHFEGNMSLTGSNADHRVQVKPSQQKLVVASLLNSLRLASGQATITAPASPIETSLLALELLEHKGAALVVSGSNDPEEQMMVNAINELLDSFGNTIITEKHLKVRQADDQALKQLIHDMEANKIDALLVYDVNPAYDYYNSKAFVNALTKVKLTIAMTVTDDETTALCTYVCPDHHFLEAWNDFEVYTGHYSMAQPAIRPIFNTRAAHDSLLRWAGIEKDYRSFMKDYWQEHLFTASLADLSFTDFWNKRVHDGVFDTRKTENGLTHFNPTASIEALSRLKAPASNGLDLLLYTNVSVGSGKHANNPWLQELPDPVSKVCWDNYVAISPRLAKELDLKDEQLVRINGSDPLPILIQPGQEYKTLGVALGYGRERAGKPANGVGRNMFGFQQNGGDTLLAFVEDVRLEKAGGTLAIARTQSHHSMEGRSIVRETTLEEYLTDPQSGNEIRKEIQEHLKTLYPKIEYDGLHWGMAIDLNACTGCNACVVSCSVENNVPVVGKEQVIMAREMHWIRIDRYYTDDMDNPELVRQPVMCQHCDNAPCENVCPVAATTHSNEGLNQMAYNRCIGTRYCANNCPYKVRRFNYFDHTGADAFKGNRYDPVEMTTDLRRMVLNPDVTVRAKGVIEKCSFCVQRIQDKKLLAKKQNRPLRDGEVIPACAQACPADAIVFGNLNDKNSKVSKYYADARNYHLLEELHTLPSVGYLTKVKNKTV